CLKKHCSKPFLRYTQDGVRPVWTWNSPTEQLEMQDIHAVRTGKSVKQMFWAGFSHNRRTGLVPLDGDPDTRHSGVTNSIISDLYQSYDISTQILSILEISLCMTMHLWPVHT